MNREQKIKKIGDIGEKIVSSLLTSSGHRVVMSEDVFDSEKDMISDGLKVEVKTLVLIKKYSAFCIGSNQWRKIDGADRVFFVRIPPSSLIDVYEKKTTSEFFEEFFNGDRCRFYPLTGLSHYSTISDELLSSSLRELSPSRYL